MTGGEAALVASQKATAASTVMVSWRTMTSGGVNVNAVFVCVTHEQDYLDAAERLLVPLRFDPATNKPCGVCEEAAKAAPGSQAEARLVDGEQP